MWLKGFLSDSNGDASSQRLINYLVLGVSTYCIIKAFSAIPPSDPMGLATLLSGYIAAFTIPAAWGKFAERPSSPNVTASGDVNIAPNT